MGWRLAGWSGQVRSLTASNARPELPAVRRATLSGIKVDGASRYDGHKPLTGNATFEIEDLAGGAISGCALRVRYFRPEMKREIIGYWHSNARLVPPCGELNFSFDPFYGKNNPDHLHGPMVLFFQLMTGRDWMGLVGCRRISNVTASVIEIG